MVSDMLTNFYKSIVYINQTEFPKCIVSSNGIKLDDFYDRLSDESTCDEIISKINAITNESAFDG